MSTQPPKHPLSPDELRSTLRALGHVRGPGAEDDEREFAAALHRRLAAAGQPPAPTWLGALRELLARSRPLVTGAVLGALVTATTFMLLGASRGPLGAAMTAELRQPAAARAVEVSPAHADTKAHRTFGDRRLTRDRLGDDIGAERPERARAHVEKR